MKWQLLNQHFMHSVVDGYHVSVLEEEVSSEEQLVVLLASGRISPTVMSSAGQRQQCSVLHLNPQRG